MDYIPVIRSCLDEQVSNALENAIAQLMRNDIKLLELDVNERAIAHRLAGYLEPYFPDHSVDAEYNRMGEVPKRLQWRTDEEELVYPDIIVHQRGARDNLLVIELKKSSNDQTKEHDCWKLEAFREDEGFAYKHALFVRVGVGELAGAVVDCEWI